MSGLEPTHASRADSCAHLLTGGPRSFPKRHLEVPDGDQYRKKQHVQHLRHLLFWLGFSSDVKTHYGILMKMSRVAILVSYDI